ncbi:MAG: hypothetical protein WCE58_13670 [Gallionella sp.]
MPASPLNATNATQERSEYYETFTVSNPDIKDRPVTFGHIQLGWRILLVVCSVISFTAWIVWWASAKSSQLAQHDEDIKEIKVSTERLINDAAVTSVKLQSLSTQVDKLEDHTFTQEQLKPKKGR